MQRNRILQRRLNALRAETRRFLRSVLNNPENQCQERRLQMSTYSEDEIVSSTTEKVSTLLPPLNSDSNKNLFHEAVFACNNLDHTNDKSNLINLQIQTEANVKFLRSEANNFSDDA